MCGIVGVKSDEAPEKVFKGLKRLEYRGYDSAGIAVHGNPSVKVEKGVGTVDEVTNAGGDSSVSIGHTRWATHGGVTDQNAHPHTDCTEEVAVVHNGIINNYEQLKEELKEKGHEFRSETDTEVIPHLIEEYIDLGVKEACQKAMDRLEGSYAVGIVFKSGEMAAFRQDSPLVIGVKDDSYYLASDVTAFLEFASDAIFMEDGDLAIIDDELDIYNEGERVERELNHIEWDAEQASKAGYEHFMEKEINEQSQTIKRAAFQDRSDMEKAEEMLDEAEDIYLTGCGTASYAAMMGAKYLRKAGYNVEVEQSHELEYRTEELDEDDLVIAVSQSGETADLLSVLKKTDTNVLAVVNVVESTLARKSNHSLFVNAGPEIGVASTKAFTAQLTVLKLLSYTARDQLEDGRKSLLSTAEKVDEILDVNSDTVEDISQYFQEKNDVYFIGRNLGKELALESALKLKELSYIHSEGFAGGEFKHGTLALIEDGVPVVSFMDHENTEILSNAVEARSRGADIIGVGSEPLDGTEFFIQAPVDRNSEILEIIPFQAIAYRTAVLKGHNPDKPRNLAKSVTVK